MAVFYLVSTVVAGFSSILGYGLSQLHGKHGIAGWSWILYVPSSCPSVFRPPLTRARSIVEGAITIGVSLLAAFLIVDFPDKNTFLTRAQTQLMIDRVNADRGDALPDALTGAKLRAHLSDWRMWSFALCFMSSTMPSYAFSYFLPVVRCPSPPARARR